MKCVEALECSRFNPTVARFRIFLAPHMLYLPRITLLDKPEYYESRPASDSQNRA